MRRKFIMTIGILLILGLFCPISAIAATIESEMPEVKTNLVITDPETGEVWKFDISENVIIQQPAITPFSLNGNNIGMTVVDVALGDYLMETFVITDDASATKTSDIILTTGFTYNRDVETTGNISMYTVFGSTINQGSYYAENRKVYWRNPGAYVGGTLAPTSSEWEYSVDSKSGGYNSNYPPYSLLECDVRVAGMTAYRTVEVICELLFT